jgi:hypothetical protein
MKKYILIPLLILSNFVFGQDSITYKYNVDLTGTINNANNNQQNNLVFSTFNSVNWKKFETGMSTNYQLMTTNGNILVNDFTLRVQPRIIDKDYSVFTFGQISQLTSKKINQRIETGVGGGITTFRTKYLENTLSYGVLYYDNTYVDPAIVNSGIRHSPRTQFFGEIKNYKLKYFTECLYQPKVGETSDYILAIKSWIKFDLNKLLGIKLQYTTAYESFFAKGATNDIKNFLVGINYSLN